MTTKLTRRQVEVLGLVAEGLTDPEIAALLCISPRTASCHVHGAMGVLGAATRAHAVYLHFVANGGGNRADEANRMDGQWAKKNRTSRR